MRRAASYWVFPSEPAYCWRSYRPESWRPEWCRAPAEAVLSAAADKTASSFHGELSVESFGSGVYILQIVKSGHVKTFKFVKK